MAVSPKNDLVATGSSNRTGPFFFSLKRKTDIDLALVALWDLPKVNLRACITRGELPIRHIQVGTKRKIESKMQFKESMQFSPSGTYLVVAADEPRIRVINANDHTQVAVFLKMRDKRKGK